MFRYTIEISHGRFKWNIKRRYKHFYDLKNHLEVYRAKLLLKHPTMITRTEKVPRFPHRPEVTIISEAKKAKHMKRLQKFIQCVVHDDKLRNHRRTLEFLEVSHISFVKDLGDKGK